MERFQMRKLRDKCKNLLNVIKGEIVSLYDDFDDLIVWLLRSSFGTTVTRSEGIENIF